MALSTFAQPLDTFSPAGVCEKHAKQVSEQLLRLGSVTEANSESEQMPSQVEQVSSWRNMSRSDFFGVGLSQTSHGKLPVSVLVIFSHSKA